MTFSKKLNVTPEAHDAVRLAAADEGVSQSAWASERLCAAWAAVIGDAKEESDVVWDLKQQRQAQDEQLAGYEVAQRGLTWFDLDRLHKLAEKRSESPAETLAAALDALARPAGIVVPPPRVAEQGCRCDGEERDGPHHKVGCYRRTGLIA